MEVKLRKPNAFISTFKPIVETYVFELKQQKKKFLTFTIIMSAVGILIGYVLNIFPEQGLSTNSMAYMRGGLGFMTLFLLFGACFFFSAIIVSEYSEKTGYIVFPKINKFKLVLGKYVADFTLIAGSVLVYYIVLGTLSLYFYGGPLPIQFFQSFGFAMLYILTLSSFVTFFSSFMKSVNITIISTILLLLIGFSIVTQIVTMIYPNVEPIFAFDYLGNLVTYIVQEKFPTTIAERYQEFNVQGFSFRTWITPTIEMGTTMMLIYTGLFMGLAIIIFARKQL